MKKFWESLDVQKFIVLITGLGTLGEVSLLLIAQPDLKPVVVPFLMVLPTTFTMMASFYWGSSQSSKDKDETNKMLIRRVVDGTDAARK